MTCYDTRSEDDDPIKQVLEESMLMLILKKRSKIIEIVVARDIVFALAQSGVCAAFSRETNERICFLNVCPDEYICGPFRYIRRGKPDAGFPLSESESLKWPGFVEFDDVNGKVLTYSVQDCIYKVFDLKNYTMLYSISDKNVEEIRIRAPRGLWSGFLAVQALAASRVSAPRVTPRLMVDPHEVEIEGGMMVVEGVASVLDSASLRENGDDLAVDRLEMFTSGGPASTTTANDDPDTEGEVRVGLVSTLVDLFHRNKGSPDGNLDEDAVLDHMEVQVLQHRCLEESMRGRVRTPLAKLRLVSHEGKGENAKGDHASSSGLPLGPPPKKTVAEILKGGHPSHGPKILDASGFNNEE
ncbi:hypothetical protein SASPL_150368 [Salvia splendens]|uniref:Uncharacterized protein n=1 Tax=Salvia splendens TaxID=180675 RepID=A0A8X8Z1Y8_SALSN|nr:hypothetical protein SASPL_150368 [Salvia splendens]